jgi:polypeptide N-acetylgalactosaminyltransferase
VKGGNVWNNNRIVESWYDEKYKKIYYRMMPEAVGKPYGDISKNIEVKERLKCKSFDWFVENVQPDVKIPKEIEKLLNLTSNAN